MRNLKSVADRIESRTADMTALPLSDESVDVIVSNIHNIPTHASRRQASDQAARVLRPGGRLAIADLWETRQHAAHLRELGWLNVRRRNLGWRMWLRRPLVLHPLGHRHQTGVISRPDLVVIDEQIPWAAEYFG